jgi:hypothetical protein
MRLLRRPRPSADPAPDPEAVLVEVVGSRSTARLLSAACPPGWRVAATDAPTHHPCVDYVVLVAPTAARVQEVAARCRGAEFAVLLDRHAPAAEIVEALDAGATACLRDAPAELVAGHLVACRRRRAGPRSS